MVRSAVDMALNEYGLRIRDPDGHLLYWHDLTPGASYARSGYNGAICTMGLTWDQDAARSRAARPGRLRPAAGTSQLVSGEGMIYGEWRLMLGQRTGISYRANARCRGGDLFPDPPAFYPGYTPEEYVSQHLLPALAELGWSRSPRIECPMHRRQREQVEAALEKLRTEESASQRRYDIMTQHEPDPALQGVPS